MSDELYFDIQYMIDVRRLHLARLKIQEGLSNQPNDPRLFYYSATISWLEEDYDEGLSAAEAGLALSPHDDNLQFILFKLLRDLKRYPDAETIIIELIRKSPRDTEYLCGYAELMLVTFHLKKAKALVFEALRVSPNDSLAKYVATFIDIASGNLTEAESKIQELLLLHPENEPILRLLLMQLVSKKRYRSALLLAQELLRVHPNDEQLVQTIIDLKTTSHWSAIPLWPVTRFGWVGSIGIWVLFIVFVQISKFVQIPWFDYVVWGYLAWCIYTWLHGPIFNRFFKVRGF